MFTVSVFQYVGLVVALSTAAPYRRPLFTNCESGGAVRVGICCRKVGKLFGGGSGEVTLDKLLLNIHTHFSPSRTFFPLYTSLPPSLPSPPPFLPSLPSLPPLLSLPISPPPFFQTGSCSASRSCSHSISTLPLLLQAGGRGSGGLCSLNRPPPSPFESPSLK